MKQQSVEVRGQRIAYLESPGNRPGRAVIFVHGNSSSARTWLPVLEGAFGQRFRCLALDLPGHGQSGPAKDQADYSLPGYAAVLVDFAGALGVADPVVVGWSLGGHIALEAAQTAGGGRLRHLRHTAGRVGRATGRRVPAQ